MSFDVDNLRPKYQLVVGQPGRSYALAIAERLGLPDALLSRAVEILGPEGTALENLLETLQEQREGLERELTEARRAREQSVKEAELLRAQIETLRAREDEVLAAAAERADEMLQDTLQRAKELKKGRHQPAPKGARRPWKICSGCAKVSRLKRSPNPARTAQKSGPVPKPRRVLEPGQMVRVESYGAEGPVVELRGDDVVVQLGLLKVEVPKRDVKLKESGAQKTRKGASFAAPVRFDDELNIRGERVEAGLEKLRDFVLEAHALKAPSVRILHGKGTGTLRDAVRNYLKDEKKVEKFEDAVPYEGGHGGDGGVFAALVWVVQKECPDNRC